MQVKQFFVIAVALAVLPPGSVGAIWSLQKVTDQAEQGLRGLGIVARYGLFAGATAATGGSAWLISNAWTSFSALDINEDPFGSIQPMVDLAYAASATALTLQAWDIALRNRARRNQQSSYELVHSADCT